MNNEVWKQVPQFDLYEASDWGRVRNRHTGRILKYDLAGRERCRYYCVRIYSSLGRKHGILLQKVIWEAFNGPIPDGFQVDHIDGDRKNNRLDNLRLLTHAQNQAKRGGIFAPLPEYERPKGCDCGDICACPTLFAASL